MPGTVRFGNNTDHQYNQLLNALAQARSLSLSGLTANMAGLFAYNNGRLYILNEDATAFELIATDSDLVQGFTAAQLRDRTTHTGTQPASSISDFNTAVQQNTLDSLADPVAAVAMNGQKITGLADGTAGSDAASYGQLLAVANNQSFKAPVKAATTAAITLISGGAPSTLDGVTLVQGDRVLVKDQTAGEENGIFVVDTVGTGANGSWSRATDFDSSAEALPGSIVPVQQGTTNGDKLFMLITNGPITLGTTPLVFNAYGASSGEIGVAGAGLTKTGSTYDVVGGTGVQVSADAVAIDTTLVTRVKRGTIPAGASAAVTINHALALPTNAHIAYLAIVERSSGDEIKCGWTTVDPNNVSVTLPKVPLANEFDWTVVG